LHKEIFLKPQFMTRPIFLFFIWNLSQQIRKYHLALFEW
jgi:hypothetical protein